MRKFFLCFISLGWFLGASSQIIGNEAERLVPGSETVTPGKYSKVPEYVRFRSGESVPYEKFEAWLNKQFSLPKTNGFKLLSKDEDKLGFVHYRLQQTINGVPVEGTMYIVHTKNGMVESMNGQVLTDNTFPALRHKVKESRALASALKYTGAQQYKWQLPETENTLKQTTQNPNATYYPKAELVYLSENGDLKSKRIHLAYKFDIYAAKPLSRNYVFVDAATGRVIHTLNRIQNSNALATAHTQYSGLRTITTDNYGAGYQLEEAGRGLGIATYNLRTSTALNTAIEFLNGSTNWNNVNAALDQYATDAHLAAEATYDFYMNNFGRNSLNNAGLKLISFVHYDVSLENAFWDGNYMNYGDGKPADGTHPLTSLEIGGHEITHGLTQYTANLNYQNESGALDESFSDCMGVSIRQSIKQLSNIDYFVGDEIAVGYAFRSMASPKDFAQPNTYFGTNWAVANGPDNGGVHINSGVQNYWFYLVSHGGSGTNDIGHSYNVTGIGIDEAAAITFRNLTVYLTTTSQFADARTYSIQSAIDLYGICSPEVIAVTNAWYAVGVGAAFSGVVQADFSENATSFCSPPAAVYFTSSAANATQYHWDFGDGYGSVAQNPSHTYNSYGNYTVKLFVSSTCGVDSVIKTQLVHINNDPPVATNRNICAGQSATLSASVNSGTVRWYSSSAGGAPLATGNTYVTPAINNTTTYYAEKYVSTPVHSCGPATDNFGTGGYFNNANVHSVIFNCTTPQTLLTVDVYAHSVGNRTIYLTDSTGNILQTATVHLATGLNTIELDFPLPVASNLYLSLGTTVDLYRNQTGASYPYTSTDGTVIITNSDAGASFYYYFYNWKLQTSPCISARAPVVVNVVNSSGSFTYSANNTTANFIPSATGLNSYQWIFGDGNSSTDQSPSHTYLAAGSYTVTLIQSNGNCGDTVVQTISIATTGINDITGIESFSIFPNPTGGMLNINIGTQQANEWKLSINNIVGQTLFIRNVHLVAGNNSLTVDVSAYAAGVYFISLSNGEAIVEQRKFVKSS